MTLNEMKALGKIVACKKMETLTHNLEESQCVYLVTKGCVLFSFAGSASVRRGVGSLIGIERLAGVSCSKISIVGIIGAEVSVIPLSKLDKQSLEKEIFAELVEQRKSLLEGIALSDRENGAYDRFLDMLRDEIANRGTKLEGGFIRIAVSTSILASLCNITDDTCRRYIQRLSRACVIARIDRENFIVLNPKMV